MKVVYLHIGTHKTGTTAIQKTLYAARSELLKQGYFYPIRHFRWAAHHELAWSLGVDNSLRDLGLDQAALWRDTLNGFDASGVSRMILSSEDFLFLEQLEQLEQLRSHLRDYRVEVIVYLRRQDRALVSTYNQHVYMKDIRFADDIFQFYAYHNFAEILRYDLFLRKWEEIFGIDALSVRLYDRTCPDVVSDFLSGLGIDLGSSFNPPTKQDSNASFSLEKVEFLRHLNRHPLDPSVHERVVELLRGIRLDRERPLGDLLSTAYRKRILSAFLESNAEVARRYLNGVNFDYSDLEIDHVEGGGELGRIDHFEVMSKVLDAYLRSSKV